MSHRAISSRVHAWVTTTVLWCAGMKVSLVVDAEDSVTAVSALDFVNRCKCNIL